MSGRPKIFGSGKSAGALTAWMKQSSPKLVVIQHVRLGSIGYHVFEPNKLSWLLAGVPDDITLAEALELEDAEPVAPDVVESLLHEAEDGEDLTFDEAPGPWLPPPEPTRRTPPVSQTPEPASTAAPANRK